MKCNRVICYIDGFNLYYGLKHKNWKKYYWVNLNLLINMLIKKRPEQKLIHTHYFTARVINLVNNNNNRQLQNQNHQNTWLNALGTLENFSIHYGHYLEKIIKCKACETKWLKPEEKMTDVNIATQMLSDFYTDKFDTAILISGDSDLATPLKVITEKSNPLNKKVVVVFPPKRHSLHLKKIANGVLRINENLLRNSLFPNCIIDKNGRNINKPINWQ